VGSKELTRIMKSLQVQTGIMMVKLGTGITKEWLEVILGMGIEQTSLVD
jgi:hypothetical protein